MSSREFCYDTFNLVLARGDDPFVGGLYARDLGLFEINKPKPGEAALRLLGWFSNGGRFIVLVLNISLLRDLSSSVYNICEPPIMVMNSVAAEFFKYTHEVSSLSQ